MKTFRCGQCQQVVYFESTRCVRCDAELCFLPDVQQLSAVESLPQVDGEPERIRSIGIAHCAGRIYRRCKNQQAYGVCNWVIPDTPDAREPTEYCRACELNAVVPDLSQTENLTRWQHLEAAKRRLLYSLTRLGLPYISKTQDAQAGLSFKFLADAPGPDGKVLTGHADGVITINVAEADASYRERTRERLGEAYRTLLGHFRHESGHYYWDRLIRDTHQLDAFRELFGDERADYATALKEHYSATPSAVRAAGFVSSYAAMHPWEDWAETWAHYLHIVDTLETARGYGLTIAAQTGANVELGQMDLTQFEDLLSNWLPVTLALNSLNRSMGQPDPYPFTIDDRIVAKLRFIHQTIYAASEQAGGIPASLQAPAVTASNATPTSASTNNVEADAMSDEVAA